MEHRQQRRRDDEANQGSVAPEIGRAGLRIAMLLILPALVMLFLQPRHSPEFVITAITLAIGVTFLAVVIGAMWLINRRL